MYEFWYDYAKPKCREKTKFCYTDTESFIVYIKTKGIYVDIWKDAETRFDSSNYELDTALLREQKTNWLMRDELGRKIISLSHWEQKRMAI